MIASPVRGGFFVPRSLPILFYIKPQESPITPKKFSTKYFDLNNITITKPTLTTK